LSPVIANRIRCDEEAEDDDAGDEASQQPTS
jgi:hypothetical protein